jgi:hypothetical protein
MLAARRADAAVLTEGHLGNGVPLTQILTGNSARPILREATAYGDERVRLIGDPIPGEPFAQSQMRPLQARAAERPVLPDNAY